MDSFESLVSMLLEHEGYWVRSSYKVVLTKSEKNTIGRPSSPRWEIDLVAYKGATNELLAVECKSYLDSAGVHFKGFDGSDLLASNRYKLFNDTLLRKTVLRRLVKQLEASGACGRTPSIRLALAAGKIARANDRLQLKAHFAKHKWLLIDDEWMRERLLTVSAMSYENNIAAVVAKLLLRK